MPARRRIRADVELSKETGSAWDARRKQNCQLAAAGAGESARNMEGAMKPKEDGLSQGSAPPPRPEMFVPTRGQGDQNVILFSEYKWVLALILASFQQKNIRLHIWFKARPSPLQKAGWPVQPASAAVQGCVQSQKHMAPSGGLP